MYYLCRVPRKVVEAEFGVGNLHDYGARWYDASIGRFTTVDPLAEKYSFQSPYAYATNNPVLLRDIMGMGVTDDYYYDKDGNLVDYVKTKDGDPDRIFVQDGDGKKEHDGGSYKQVLASSDNYDYSVDVLPQKAADDRSYVFSEYADGNVVTRAAEVVERDISESSNSETVSEVMELLETVFYRKMPGAKNRKVLGAKKKNFRPGKQRNRDRNIFRYPKEFRRWFHKEHKQKGSPDATTKELKELFDEWTKYYK